ncbi:MAG: PQQ-binding-like beta-propeller repeat protein [bacterium]|nr:PQQ-binding-like beta-propeller repeat protein [bacterium]
MRRTSLVFLSTLFLSTIAQAQDWPQWRGPSYDGAAEATGLPTDFDQKKHVLWSTELPGPGAGTPIVFGTRVFVTSIDADKGELLAICIDRDSGKVLWRKSAGSGYSPGAPSKTHMHDRSNFASPSPVTDGERVVFSYGNGDLVAYDLDGEELWRRNLQKDYGDFTFQWTFSASPTLWNGKLYMQVLQRDEPVHGRGEDGNASFLLSMDPATGKTLKRIERPSEANKESLESYATPIPFVGEDGRKELLIVGGDVITGHDPDSLEELWRWGTWNEGHREIWWRLVPSPVVGGGVVLACGPKRAPVYAIELGGKGELTGEDLAWKSSGRPNPVSSDVPTPLFYGGSFYVLSDVREALSRLDPATGEVKWTIEMPGKHRWRASPTGADGKIWCMNHAGQVAVVDAESGKIVAAPTMGDEDDDGIRSSLVVAHGRLFIRTNSKLFCVGDEQAK